MRTSFGKHDRSNDGVSVRPRQCEERADSRRDRYDAPGTELPAR